MSKNKNKNWIWIVLILLIVTFSYLYFSGTLQEQLVFEEGFEPYGESSLTISNLDESNWGYSYNNYWNFSYWVESRRGDGEDYPRYPKVSGNDFDITMGPQSSCSRYMVKRFVVTPELTTMQDFSNKDFKSTIKWSGKDYVYTSVLIFLNDKKVYTTKTTTYGTRNRGGVLEINPSPVSDKVNIYWNSLKENEVTMTGEYNIRIQQSSGGSPCNSGGSLQIINPRWREQFGCSKKPNEQYYLKVFKEGNVMDLGDFPNWNKFCVDREVTIYTPSGSTTTREPLLGMVDEDKSYTIPPGQIWTVEYIGDLKDPETACEKGEVYNLEDEQCIARTKITFDFGDNETKTVETEPVVYEQVEIKTHQNLEEDREFAFKHINQDNKNLEESFMVGNNRFVSRYESVAEGQDGRFTFEYKNTKYTAEEGRNIDLSNYLSVNVEEVKDDKDPFGKYNDASIRYEFNIDTSFLDVGINKKENKVIINNSYKQFPGGITLITTDKLDRTTVENIDLTLNKGTNTYELEEEYREISARPYITIDTPEYKYTFNAKYGASTSPTFFEEVNRQYQQNPTLGLILVIIFTIIIISLLLWIIKNIVKK